MRRGCISLGDIYCDSCHENIPYPDRYLIIEEEGKGKERLCLECVKKRGYPYLKRGEGYTFFAEELPGATE